MAAPAQSSTSAPVSAKTSSASAPSKKTVRELQQLLKDLGYDPGPVDGLNGGRTTNALYAWINGLGEEEDREKAHDAANAGDYGALTEMMRSLSKVQVATTGTGQNAAGAARLAPASDQTQVDDQQEFDEVTSQQLSQTWADIAQYNIEQSAQGLIFMDRLKEKAIAEVRDIANSLFGFDDDGEDTILEIEDTSSTFDTNVLDNSYTATGYRLGEQTLKAVYYDFYAFDGPVYTTETLPEALKPYLEFIPDVTYTEGDDTSKFTFIAFMDRLGRVSIVPVREVAPGVFTDSSSFLASSRWILSVDTITRLEKMSGASG